MPELFRVDVAPSEQVTAIVYPAAPRDPGGISLILGHGAGANQTSGFMVDVAGALAARASRPSLSISVQRGGPAASDRNDGWKPAGAASSRPLAAVQSAEAARAQARDRRQIDGRPHRLAGRRHRSRRDRRPGLPRLSPPSAGSSRQAAVETPARDPARCCSCRARAMPSALGRACADHETLKPGPSLRRRRRRPFIQGCEEGGAVAATGVRSSSMKSAMAADAPLKGSSPARARRPVVPQFEFSNFP